MIKTVYQKTINLKISWTANGHAKVWKWEKKSERQDEREKLACAHSRGIDRMFAEVERHDKFNVLLIKPSVKEGEELKLNTNKKNYTNKT